MNDASTLLREVLLGRATWRDLASAGLVIRAVPGGWAFGPVMEPAVVATEAELRQGIATQIDAADHGREWASFLLSASDLFDLERLSDAESATADQVVEALWDLSCGEVEAARERL